MGSCRYVGIFGKRVSSLCCGHFSDKYGRTKTLMGNCVFMIVGGRRIKLLAVRSGPPHRRHLARYGHGHHRRLHQRAAAAAHARHSGPGPVDLHDHRYLGAGHHVLLRQHELGLALRSPRTKGNVTTAGVFRLDHAYRRLPSRLSFAVSSRNTSCSGAE
ncbi:hypothetical protein PC116_g11855 [Phytophthora cactorum]|uniref:Uncharacterized protein n=1 Tax=Phytophthora cactorum TaxID=29920 RepID=A0A8T1E2F2_9STRA|nr:hypothetical protein PC114_g2895 [Phytophthora cactorum]KAG2945292.1 hypothetical protein PC117_g8574 [Phytophthora cactorum]KAG3020261.1 hypothetical protein PC120_g9353 [Phytophthora cactorum]KAG3187675.1 hypothetical protein PC128_g12513 [Phytophthora cactorum]KAG4057757.1 hypothetical protein PC123_g7260 [Phytophthora cactorum]